MDIESPVVFANVILPIPLPRLFTYRVPESLVTDIAPGQRAIVQFGARRFYSAIVHDIHSVKPEGYEVKEIISLLDDKPVVNSIQLKFWKWIADYYICSVGEVMKAALPSGLKLESETRVFFNADFETSEPLSDSEELILNLLSERNMLSVQDIAKIYKKRDLLKVIKKLVDAGALMIEESLRDRHRVKSETYVELLPHLCYETELKLLFDTLGKAPKQLQFLTRFVELSGIFTPSIAEVSRKLLISDIKGGSVVLKTLIKKNVFRTYEKNIAQAAPESSEHSLKPLSEAQQEALTQVKEQFVDKPVVLLHGYTASGKTELYIHLIDEQIKAGKQVLYLLPEIALTTQIINRLANAFGDKVGIYHSKFSDSDRVKVWKGLVDEQMQQRYQVILGVRSSVFLPFENLGLIIVDEEHENTYKQFDPAPRYHARDVAIVLAGMHGAKTLLGTATPSIETYFNSKSGKYGLVELFRRYSDVELPEISLANIEYARMRKQMKSHFHPILLESIKTALDQGEQVILFQNKRGFSPYFQCADCQAIPRCKNCDVSLTYHKNLNQLVCHYCGYSTSKIAHCSACGSTSMVMRGFGTEKIEDELSLFFPGRSVARMDLDTTRSRRAYEEMIADFESHDLDILVGTQMVTKGLDFDNVSLVGVLDADHLLNFPDFRAYERSFQLMSQVSGRAGRKNKRGKVIIQTTDPQNYVLQDVIKNDFQHLYQSQLADRQGFGYPPFTRLIQLTLKHKNQAVLDPAADYLASSLRKIFGKRVYGPEYPLVSRISNWYQKNIMIKIERQASVIRAKELITEAINDLHAYQQFQSVTIQPDVDPM
ncbi:MAG: primosomal protein N' [Bacteroidota bacterium]|nr:primosomal protein N' [Bacteroidota bacterium]